MGKVQNLFPKWYYHGEVEKHESLKALLLYELGTATLTQPKEWNCSVSSSFESDTNQDDFSWHKFNEYISDNFMGDAHATGWACHQRHQNGGSMDECI